MMKKIKHRILSFLQRKLGIVQVPLPLYTNDIPHHKVFEIGDFTYGNPSVLFENKDATLKIGRYCSIAENVTIFLGGNHRYDWVTTYPFNALNNDFPEASDIKGHPSTNGDVVIENDVWIGRGATIMSGVKIENGAILAAGTVITKNVGPYEIWGGNPAKLIKKRFDDETIQTLLKIEWWEWPLNKIKKNTHILCSSNIKLLKNEI